MSYKMKLLTFNTHSLVAGEGERQVSVLAEAILKEKFDVIALQEVNQKIGDKESNFAFRVVSRMKEMGEDYAWTYLPIKIGYGIYDEGLAFLSRAPLAEIRSGYLSKTHSYDNWKTRMALGIRPEGSEAWFWNLHMSWWEDPDEPFCAQWVRLLSLLSPKEEVWLMGDFNNPAEIRGEGYDLVRESGFYDAYELAEKRQGAGTASAGIDGWHGRSVAAESLRIDQIWSSRPRKISFCHTIFDGERYDVISDHFGVAIGIENR